MYKIYFYAPFSHLESILAAMFAAGAGQIGDYSQCCWMTEGLGQFCSEPGSRPFLGTQGKVEQVQEMKVELVCQDKDVREVLKALIQSHPYEKPAYGAFKILVLEDFD